MTAIVKMNYDRYVNAGIVPSTDFENSVMEDILTWAEETFDPSHQIQLSDMIDLYWMCQLEGVTIERIEDDP